VLAWRQDPPSAKQTEMVSSQDEIAASGQATWSCNLFQRSTVHSLWRPSDFLKVCFPTFALHLKGSTSRDFQAEKLHFAK
jgi:hypothetical protein